MKKFSILLLCISLTLFSLSACSDSNDEADMAEPNTEESENIEETTDTTKSDAVEDENKILKDDNSNISTESTDDETDDSSIKKSTDEVTKKDSLDNAANGNEVVPQQTAIKEDLSEPQQSVETETEVTTEQPATEPYFDSSYASEVLSLVNEQRTSYGLSALSWNDTAASAANVRATEIVGTFSHTRPDGSSCMTAYSGDYSCIGENIAAGQTNPSLVMTSWMNSEGHKENILNPSFTSLGVACYVVPGSAYTYYWVQTFIG